MSRSKQIQSKPTLSEIEQRNIFYMLLYNSDVKFNSSRRHIGDEKLKSLLDYLAYVMCEEYKSLMEKGLVNKFNMHIIQTDKPRGKVDILRQYRTGTIGKFELSCLIQKLDNNDYYNSVIKTAMRALLIMNRSESDEDLFINEQRVKQLMYYIDTLDSVGYLENLDDLNNKVNAEIPNGYYLIYQIQLIILKRYQPKSIKNNISDLEQYGVENKYYSIYEGFVRSLYRKELNEFDTSLCEKSKRNRRKKYENQDYDGVNNYLLLEPDCVVQNTDNKRLLIIDTKWYNSLAESYALADNKKYSKYNKDNLNDQIGIYNQQIGKSCLYAMAYKSLPEYRDYDVCTLVLMAKNLRSSGNYSIDEPINHQIAFYRHPDEAINFQIAVVHHTMDMNFKDIKSDLLNVARRFLSDDPLNKKLYTLR